MTNPNKVVYFAETDARNSRVRFGIKQKDRSRHIYVIGKTGMGKSTLLENMAAQDIQQGNGMCFIDPHGKTAELLLEYIPKERIHDVLYFAPFDMEHPISFNIMEDVGYDKRHLVVSGLMSAFKKIWKDAWSARMEYILSNTLFALLEYPDATLLSVNRMLSDKAFRKKVVENIHDTAVKSFWVDEFANYTERMAAEAVPAIQNKVGQFTSNPLIRNIIGQPKSSFDFREMMDTKKIIIINLSKGRMGDANAQLLGSLLVTKIYLAAMSRADVGPHEIDALPDFSLFVDEFQSFANESFAEILSEARKYKLNLHIAHQYVEQMPEEVRAAVFGNVGTLITFRVGSTDAELFEKEFAGVFTQQDIVNLGQFQLYLRLMIDGVGSRPFSARTLPPLAPPEENNIKEVIDASRGQFSRPRAEVEELVRTLTNMGRSDDVGSGNKNQKKPEKKQGSAYSGQTPVTQHAKPPHHSPLHQSQTEAHHPREGRDSVKSAPDSHLRKNDDSRIQKELTLKKQIEQAQKKIIDEMETAEEVVEQEFVSLKDVIKKPGQKEVSKENKNALKDALLKVLQQNGAPVQQKVQEQITDIPSHIEIQKEDVKETHSEKITVDVQPAPTSHKEELPKQSGNVIKPGEIPEDQLKKLLEVE
jgi:hypothetical protein